MKSFLKDLKGFGQKPEAKGQLIGKTLKVGPYTIRPENMVGEGGFATIYKVRDSTSGTVYALKHMHLMGDKDAIADCQTEVETLKRLRDVPTVLTLRAVAYAGIKGQEQEAFLLLDMCQDNLVTYLGKRDSQLPDNQVITIFHAVCQAVAAMHHCDPPLAHRYTMLITHVHKLPLCHATDMQAPHLVHSCWLPGAAFAGHACSTHDSVLLIRRAQSQGLR